jgi:predicted glycosyltransferase
VVLVDKHPFGAGGEFRDALEVLRTQGGVAVLGLRDILDAREAVLSEWRPHDLQHQISDWYEQVLVYGQRSVFDPIKEYDFPPELAQRTRFCGYIVNRPEAAQPDLPSMLHARGEPLVLATAGGGEDGYTLLEAFARAADELRVIQRLATESNVALHSFMSHLSSWFWTVDALICMGGYNTLTEALCTGVPTVCVPRTKPRSEQWLRARSFENLGLLRCLAPDDLTPSALGDAITASLGVSRQDIISRANQSLSFDGARQAASHLLALARERRQHQALRAAIAS